MSERPTHYETITARTARFNAKEVLRRASLVPKAAHLAIEQTPPVVIEIPHE